MLLVLVPCGELILCNLVVLLEGMVEELRHSGGLIFAMCADFAFLSKGIYETVFVQPLCQMRTNIDCMHPAL